jgi:hypothetical protein
LEIKVDKNWRSNSPYYFLSDSLSFPIPRVKFYQSNGVFRANVAMYEFCENNNCFARRTVKGKVNLYSYRKPNNPSNSTSSPNSVGALLLVAALSASSNKVRSFENYYNMGTGDLRKMDYRNLMVDLNENP